MSAQWRRVTALLDVILLEVNHKLIATIWITCMPFVPSSAKVSLYPVVKGVGVSYFVQGQVLDV